MLSSKSPKKRKSSQEVRGRFELRNKVVVILRGEEHPLRSGEIAERMIKKEGITDPGEQQEIIFSVVKSLAQLRDSDVLAIDWFKKAGQYYYWII